MSPAHDTLSKRISTARPFHVMPTLHGGSESPPGAVSSARIAMRMRPSTSTVSGVAATRRTSGA